MTTAMSLEMADKLAEGVKARLAPYCKEKADGSAYIEVAGSVRRRKQRVNDVDFVLIPSDPWNLHQEVLRLCRPFPIKASGLKIMRIMVGAYQVDIYVATPENWETILLIRTGSAENNIRLCSRAKDLGWHLHASGEGLFNERGERIAGDSELSIYNALGLPWQRPEERG